MAILTKKHHVEEMRHSQNHAGHPSHTLFPEMHCIWKPFTVCDSFAWDHWTVSSASSVPLRVTSDTLSHSQSDLATHPCISHSGSAWRSFHRMGWRVQSAMITLSAAVQITSLNVSLCFWPLLSAFTVQILMWHKYFITQTFTLSSEPWLCSCSRAIRAAIS